MATKRKAEVEEIHHQSEENIYQEEEEEQMPLNEEDDFSESEVNVTFEMARIEESDYHGSLHLFRNGILGSLIQFSGGGNGSSKKKKKAKQAASNKVTSSSVNLEDFVDGLISQGSATVSRIEGDDSPMAIITELGCPTATNKDVSAKFRDEILERFFGNDLDAILADKKSEDVKSASVLLLERWENVPPHCTPDLMWYHLEAQKSKVESLKNHYYVLISRLFDDAIEGPSDEPLTKKSKSNLNSIASSSSQLNSLSLDQLVYPEYEFFLSTEKESTKPYRIIRTANGSRLLATIIKADELENALDQMSKVMQENLELK